MSRAFFEKVKQDEGLRRQVAEAIRSAVPDQAIATRGRVRELVVASQADPGLKRKLSAAIGEVALRNGAAFAPDEAYEGDLSDTELELVAGGPTAVEYAVMLSLIIVVCIV